MPQAINVKKLSSSNLGLDSLGLRMGGRGTLDSFNSGKPSEKLWHTKGTHKEFTNWNALPTPRDWFKMLRPRMTLPYPHTLSLFRLSKATPRLSEI